MHCPCHGWSGNLQSRRTDPPATLCECRDALAAARRPGRTAFDEMPIEEIEAHAREAAGQVQGLLQEGW